MLVHPQIRQSNGIVTVTMTATFDGDTTDASDQQRIQAYGDPKIDLGGYFTDPAAPTFQFVFPASELWVGATTEMQVYPANFMDCQPVVPPSGHDYSPLNPTETWNPFTTSAAPTWAGRRGRPLGYGPLDCIVSDPVRAANIWAAAVQTRVADAMAILRAKTPARLTSLPDTIV